MQNTAAFNAHRTALEQSVHNTVVDDAIRNAMLAHISEMAAAMQAESRAADAAFVKQHKRRHGILRSWIVGVQECAA